MSSLVQLLIKFINGYVLMDINKLHFEKLDSTRIYVKENFKNFDSDKITIVSAFEQTNGKARYNKKWASPKGNLYITTFFKIPISSKNNFSNIPQIAAMSVVKTLKSYGIDSNIKWPNDILVNGKKVSGLMGEMISLEKDEVAMMLSCGLNVNMSNEDIGEIDQAATSMKNEKLLNFDEREVLQTFIDIFVHDLKRFFEKGFLPFYDEINKSMLGKNKIVVFHNRDGKNQIKGKFLSFNKDGSITLLFDDEIKKTFFSGEMTLF
jgi:BirA family transcriptional regulator, biotin operon repressor / biotin---[acetyl-CoA-carboxylase] ligase